MLMREGIRQVISRHEDLEVIGECADLPSLLEAVDSLDPDVVVTDVRMPPGQSDEGIRFAGAMREAKPELGVVVLSQYNEPSYANSLLQDGSDGRAYLLKERVSEPGQLLDAIRTVSRGGSVIDPQVVERLVRATNKSPSSPLSTLSKRELEVLGEVAQGKSNEAVARTLFLSERAVEKHINALFAKLGLTVAPEVNRRVTAVLLWLSERDAR
jgi:DNA-binding NarL/FixJ family response regulator